MMHVQATNNIIHKTHHDIDLAGGHHFAPYNILYDCLMGVHQCGKKT
jgi:hypothetical protein